MEQNFKYTKSPWQLCRHLQSERKDKECSCGYRGGIWGDDKVICEIGSTEIEGDLNLPRHDRTTELANARLIAAAPELLEKCVKITGWLNKLADAAERRCIGNRFESLVEANRADAKNYRNTANDIQKIIDKVFLEQDCEDEIIIPKIALSIKCTS